MKKLFSVVSLLTCLACGGVISTSSTVELPGVETEGETTYIVTIDQDVKSSKADSTRNRVLNEIRYHLPDDSYTIDYVYKTVMNGFAITTDSAYKDYIGSLTGVESIEEAHRYAAPTTDVTDTASGATTLSAENNYKEEKLANYSAETMEATDEDIREAIAERRADGSTASQQEAQAGKGITIGIIDTGLYLNQVDGTDERTALEGQYGDILNAPAFQDSADIVDTLSEEKIASLTGLNARNPARYGDKIAFAYDYEGGDNDVNTSSEHGTHVASLAAGNGDDFQGIAPNAQLAIMKVFPDDGSGAYDSTIIAAIEDAAVLGLDIINLSLGTDLFDYDDEASNAVYEAIDGAVEAGVIVNYAAGNSGKSSFSGSKGYSDWTTDTVETSFIGGSALYDENINTVASSNPDKAFYESIVMVNGNVVSYYDQVVNRTNSTIEYDEEHPFTELLGDESTGEFTYVRLDGIGNAANYTDFYEAYNAEHGTNISSLSEVSDGPVISVINRGDITFQQKLIYAENNNADALIVVNNEPSVTFNFNFDFNDYQPSIPVILVFQNTGSYFGENNSVGTLSIQTNTVVESPDGNISSSFTSDGPSYNLDLVPEVSAPGSSVIGAISASTTGDTSGIVGYDNLSGTSMATPNFSGGLASILSEFLPSNDSVLSLTDEEYAEYKSKISDIVMSSADQLVDGTGSRLGSVRLQGAGIINVADAIGNGVYVTTDETDDSQSTASAEDRVTTGEQVSKVELKNRGSLFKTDLSEDEEAYIEFSYTIHNGTDETKYYTPRIDLGIPDLEIQMTQADYDSSLASDPTTVADVADNLPGAITMSVNDQALEVPDDNWEGGRGTVTVAADSDATFQVKVRIDNIQVDKEFDTYNPDGEEEVEDFSGTLREYFDEYFDDAGGSYVEGYFYLDETDAAGQTADVAVSHTLSMPYLGFYGDYTKGEAVEPFQFEKEDGHLYNSELADAYLQNTTSNAKTNCYTGSTLTATGSALTSSQISSIASLNSSAYQDGSNYLSIVQYDDDGNLYLKAGGESADHIISVFYVNRSISSGTWQIQNSTGNITSSGSISDIYDGTNYGTSYGIVKSHIVSGSSTLAMHHGFADIDISNLAEGTYTLSYNFTLRGTGTTQTKSYTLVVDHTPPSLVSIDTQLSASGNPQLVVTTRGGDASIRYSGVTVVPSQVDGSDDLYQATITVTDRMLSNDTLNITITDSAYNSINVIVNLSNLDCIIYGEDVPSSGSFVFQQLRASNGEYSYEFVLTDASGNDVEFDGEINLLLYVGSDIDTTDLYILINGEDFDSWTYDAETGYITLTGVEIIDGYADITMNAHVLDVELPSGDEDTEPTDPDTDPDQGENPDDGDVDVENPDGGDTDTDPGDEESSGLTAWQIALIAIACVVVVGVVVGLIVYFTRKSKKKKDNTSDNA